MSKDRRARVVIAAALLALAGLGAWVLWQSSISRDAAEAGSGHGDPSLGAGPDGTARGDAGATGPEGVAAGGEGSDPYGQDQSTEGRSDGAVPYVATPPYQSPTADVVVLSPADLRARRLEQVALIERSIAEIDREIALAPGTPNRVLLLGRREHLEGRRAELLATVLEEP